MSREGLRAVHLVMVAVVVTAGAGGAQLNNRLDPRHLVGGSPEPQSTATQVVRHTVAGGGPDVLILNEQCGDSTAYLPTVLGNLGLPFVETNDDGSFLAQLTSGTDWGLVIVDQYANELSAATYSALTDYIDDGGRLFIAYWFWDEGTPELNALIAALEASFVSIYLDPETMFVWEPAHPLFTSPNAVGDLAPTDNRCFKDGGRFNAAGAGLTVAGYVPAPTTDQHGIIVGNDGRTILFGGMPGLFNADGSGSGTNDMEEFLENAVSFLLMGQPLGAWSMDRTSELFVVDPPSGGASSIGPLGIENATGSAIDPLTGNLYTNPGGGGCCPTPISGCLYTVDRATGAATQVGCDPNQGGNDPIPGLAFGPDGVLYGIRLASNAAPEDDNMYLATVDTATGFLTDIGMVGPWCGGHGAEFGSDGVLYVWDVCVGFRAVDTTDATSTIIGGSFIGFPTTDFPRIPDMARDAEGNLWAVVVDGSMPNQLYYFGLVDTTTGDVTYVSTAAGDFHTLAFGPLLEGPIADISPSSFVFEVDEGESDSDTLNVGNLGSEDLIWSITPAGPAGGFEPENSTTDSEGHFDIANWTLENNPPGVGGSFATNPGPPVELFLTGGDDGTGGDTDFWIAIPQKGEISFDWGYQSTDTGDWDRGGYFINGAFIVLANNASQVPYFDGSASGIAVSAGDIFGFRVQTEDGEFGPGILGVTSFQFEPAPFDCDDPTTVPWLDVSPDNGVTPPSGSVPVDVTVDATGLAPGDYEAHLCISTNDPTQPLVVVPIELTVLEGPCPVGPTHLVLENVTLSGTEVYEACSTITAGPNFTITSTGDVTFRAGHTIILRSGVEIETGAKFVGEIDPSLVIP